MYQLMVRRDFVAQHYLTVPDCGPENAWHSHHFHVDVHLEGASLDENGYLVDIVELNDALEAVMSRYRDRTLNDLPEFADQNPSIERFAGFLAERLTGHLDATNLDALTVKLWEDATAWASYRTELPPE
ncbi:MAG: 6-pyruvoyl tetrahydropterin synthase family protein [Candidatus Bipolaricaulia bacterium]